MPEAILFDLDESLMDRTQSIAHYAERFRRDFMGGLAPLSASTLAAVIFAAEGRGYRSRDERVCFVPIALATWYNMTVQRVPSSRSTGALR